MLPAAACLLGRRNISDSEYSVSRTTERKGRPISVTDYVFSSKSMSSSFSCRKMIFKICFHEFPTYWRTQSRGINLRAFCGCTLLYMFGCIPLFSKFETVVPGIDSMTKMSAIALSRVFLLIGRLFVCDPQSFFFISEFFVIFL